MRSRQEIEKELEDARVELENVKGRRCEVYQRITGYYRGLHAWNSGKREEYEQRKEFVVPSSCDCSETVV